MKALAVLQLILAVVQVVVWFLYRRDVKRRELASQEALERLTRQAYKLDGCTCPPAVDGSYRGWHFGGCPWDAK